MTKDKTSGSGETPHSGNETKLPRRGESDILDVLRRLVPDLKDAEANTARVILQDPEWVTTASLKSVATRADVSEPTVLRLCRKLDCDGFKAFKHKLTEDLVLSRMYLQSMTSPQLEKRDEMSEALLDTAIRAIYSAAEQMDLSAIESAVSAIQNAKMVYCIGVGGSSAILAEELENRLFRLGIHAQAISDSYRQRMMASVAGTGDLIVAISSTGVPDSIVSSMELARSNGAGTLSLTQTESPLAGVSDIVLGIEIFNDETFYALPSRTRYSQLYVLDFLVAMLASRTQDAAKNLKSIRHTLKAHHGVIRYQPIGD